MSLCQVIKKRGLVPWLSAKADGKDLRFIQVGNRLLLSKRSHKLSTGARHLYFCMAMESGGHRDFIFPQSAAKKYGISPSSLRRHIRELEGADYITVQSMKNLRILNRYRFSLGWKGRIPHRKHAPPWHKLHGRLASD